MSALESLAYRHGDVGLTAWLARPQGTPRAAILVLPTIANVTAAIERRAAMLADRGYLALIPDFYGEPVADFAAAGPLAGARARPWLSTPPSSGLGDGALRTESAGEACAAA